MRRQKRQGRPVRLMFQDEARFGRINEPKRCWAPPGIRPDTPYQVVRESTYVYAAVSPHDGTVDSLILPETNSAAMEIFIKEVARRHPDEFIIMVLDSAGWHIAKQLLLPNNMKLVFLPPYSPQLNPAEHLWDEIREKWFLNKAFHNLDAVETLLVDALQSLENDKCRAQNITGFNWIININLNAT